MDINLWMDSNLGLALGSAVLQFLWQGAAIACLTSLALRAARRPEARHWIAFCALMLCMLSFVGTYLLGVASAPAALEASSPSLGSLAGVEEPLVDGKLEGGAATLAAWIWALGVAGLTLRFALQCLGAQRLKTIAVHEVDESWQRALQELMERLGIHRKVRLLGSGLAEVPMVVGWISPVVLVPSAALLSLNPDQLRSLLAHELAHIRRNDHWLNAAQAVIEILLFFHPAVWWISRQVRIEREFCCDDSSLELTGDPKLLARALASMEELRQARTTTSTVLAANGGSLMQRISRILEVGSDTRRVGAGWRLPTALVLAGVLAAATSASSLPNSVPGLEPEASLDDRSDYQAMKARIEEAVLDGRLTRAEADQTLQGLRKSLGQGSRSRVRLRRLEERKAQLEVMKRDLENARLAEQQARDAAIERDELHRRELVDALTRVNRLEAQRGAQKRDTARYPDGWQRLEGRDSELRRDGELRAMERMSRSVRSEGSRGVPGELQGRTRDLLDFSKRELDRANRQGPPECVLEARRIVEERAIQKDRYHSLQRELDAVRPAHPRYEQLKRDLQVQEETLQRYELEHRKRAEERAAAQENERRRVLEQHAKEAKERYSEWRALGAGERQGPAQLEALKAAKEQLNQRELEQRRWLPGPVDGTEDSESKTRLHLERALKDATQREEELRRALELKEKELMNRDAELEARLRDAKDHAEARRIRTQQELDISTRLTKQAVLEAELSDVRAQLEQGGVAEAQAQEAMDRLKTELDRLQAKSREH